MPSAHASVGIVSCDVQTETVDAAGWRAVYIAEGSEQFIVAVMPIFWLMTTCTVHGVSGKPMVRTKRGDVVEARNLLADDFELLFVGIVAPGEDPAQLIAPYRAQGVSRATAS